MEEDSEKKLYRIVQIIITIIVFCLGNKFVFVVGIIPYILSILFIYVMAGIPARKISKYIIRLGDTIKSKFLKVMYYIIGLPVFLNLISWGVCKVITQICIIFEKPDKYGGYTGSVFVAVFWWSFAVITICLPYIETLIVFALKKIDKKSQEHRIEEENLMNQEELSLKDELLKSLFWISQITITIIITLLLIIVLFLQHFEWSTDVIALIIVLHTFLWSFPTRYVSVFMMIIANTIKTKIFRFLYYLMVLPIVSFKIFRSSFRIIWWVLNSIIKLNDIGYLLVMIFVGIIVFLPYIETIIVSILKVRRDSREYKQSSN